MRARSPLSRSGLGRAGSLAASLAAVSVALAACGSAGGAPGTNPQGAAATPGATQNTETAEPTAAADATADTEGPLVIYSGRNENLVGPIIEQLEEAVGTEVEVRYGDSAELAAQLLEEGERTDADLFFSQDAGALGALTNAGLLAELPQEVLEAAPEQYRADDGTWVGTSGRARVIVYDPEQVPEAEVPDSIFELTEPQWGGLVGYAPTNASFQSFVTGLRVIAGEERAREWLEGFAANDPVAYERNGLILDAVDAGEIPLGLINHYYWYEKVGEVGADAVNAEIAFLPDGDPGALINVAGVGVLAPSDSPDSATAAVEFLLSEQAQQYFADETAEYPVIDGVQSTEHDLPPLSSLQAPDIDLTDLDSLGETLELLAEVGLT
jgi:iron(III) transport system substrate-binding protein